AAEDDGALALRTSLPRPRPRVLADREASARSVSLASVPVLAPGILDSVLIVVIPSLGERAVMQISAAAKPPRRIAGRGLALSRCVRAATVVLRKCTNRRVRGPSVMLHRR